MVLKADNQDVSQLDWLYWLIASILLLAGLIANHYYSEVLLPLRLLAWAVIVVVSGFVILRTQKGKRAFEFFREARVELRKVVWPTREETMQTTLVVAVMVVILALLLWGMDSILVWLIGWLTGQRS